MKHALSYIKAIEHQNKILSAIDGFPAFFSQKKTNGYVFSDGIKDNSVDITIGSERFTILSTIGKGGIITFSVFAWVFDLSSLTRYSDLKIDKLTFIKDGNSLSFKHTHTIVNEDNRSPDDYHFIFDMTNNILPKDAERIFDVIEDYIHDKDRYTTIKGY